ncbi:MAG: RidA family protein [Thermodesulfobacteriota bacterium]|nr:RidA family protein [Thermodesulfobacteriota bacterium]
MTKQIINPDSIPKPMGPYSQAVVTAGGKFVFISGQVPEDVKGNLIGKGDIDVQARQVLENLKIMIEESGGAMSDIVKITIFMVEINSFSYDCLGKLRKEFFGADYPASTMMEVKRLAKPEWLIEIEAWAVV